MLSFILFIESSYESYVATQTKNGRESLKRSKNDIAIKHASLLNPDQQQFALTFDNHVSNSCVIQLSVQVINHLCRYMREPGSNDELLSLIIVSQQRNVLSLKVDRKNKNHRKEKKMAFFV